MTMPLRRLLLILLVAFAWGFTAGFVFKLSTLIGFIGGCAIGVIMVRYLHD